MSKKLLSNLGFKNKKADIPIPIVMFTFLVVVLLFSALGEYSKARNDVIEDIMLPGEINEVYIIENEVNYHVRNTFVDVAKDFYFEDGEERFIEEFKVELLKYKSNLNDPLNEAILKIVSKIESDWVKISGDAIFLDISYDIVNKKAENGKMIIKVSHNVKKRFEYIQENIFKEETTLLD